ncbi:MAG: Smr/MutS family protein [Desulfobulbaceae bacterium]|nr:Smr/MutS family protein [Desulfobulbaceae bacterium]
MAAKITEEEAVQLPIDGVLDLHAFRPGEVKSLLAAYIEECQKMGISEVRIIHGKGSGTLRRLVHAVLERMPAVSGFRLAGEDGGGWGATLVQVLPTDEEGR